MNGAGAIKAVLTGVVITVIGSLLAGVGTIFSPSTVLGLLLMIVAVSLAFNGMMFLMMVRVEDPLVRRAVFGILNTLYFFPAARSIRFKLSLHGCEPSRSWIHSPTPCTDSKPCC